MEIFKDVNGYEGIYQISNLGRLKSLSRRVSCRNSTRLTKEKFLKPAIKDTGYLKFGLKKLGIEKQFVLHRLIAIAFIPNPLNLTQVNHKNGIKTDNRIDNLEWCTPSENLKHAYAEGLKISVKGSNHFKSKLKESDINEIRQLYKIKGNTQFSISKIYNVSRSAIKDVVNGVSWKHV